MRIRVPLLLVTTTLFLAAATAPAGTALDPAGQQRFRALLDLSRDELAKKAQEVLERKYPSEEWNLYAFPRSVYLDRPTTVAYRISVVEPETLAVAVCACFCDEMGHKNLSHCYLRGGERSSGFDAHAAGCNICVRQALLVFLWTDLGASPEKIRQTMRDEFGAP